MSKVYARAKMRRRYRDEMLDLGRQNGRLATEVCVLRRRITELQSALDGWPALYAKAEKLSVALKAAEWSRCEGYEECEGTDYFCVVCETTRDSTNGSHDKGCAVGVALDRQ